MYNPHQPTHSLSHPRADQHSRYISSPPEINPSSLHPDNYSLSQIGVPTYSYNNSVPLAAQESYQRTYISDHIALDSRSAPSTYSGNHRRMQSYDQDDNSVRGYYRADHTIYSATPPESAPYDTLSQSFHEYGMQPPTNSRRQNPHTPASMDNMLQVFSTDNVPLTDATVLQSHITSSTLTFQLGPRSLDQVEDLESLTTRSLPGDLMEMDFEENEREDSLSEPRISGSPLQLYRDSTPSETESLPLVQKGGRRKSTRRLSGSESTKRSKMHQCKICQKWFPRPSGLATHMNSHSGLRPFDCPLPTCNKSFAVRSNAKRHLRTHGIIPSPESPHKPPPYTVGFDTPLVNDVHETGERPAALRWIPQSLTSLVGVEWSKPIESESEGEDSCPTLPVPLVSGNPPLSWESGSLYEEVNVHGAASQPYHPRHWRGLPGPASM